MLRISGLSKKFGNKRVLDNVSFTLPCGQIAVFLGSSGVGKSTLLRVLNNLESIDAGTIEWQEAPLQISEVNKTHQVGMVFQHFNLFEHLSVEENITLVLCKVLGKSSTQAHQEAMLLLTHYGLADKALYRVNDLSGGQKQRLALARTLATKPQIICLDEPTSALDPLLTTYVAHMIQGLAQQGYTVLIATHDTTLVQKLSCTLYLMEHGSIIESAPSDDFISNQRNYPRLAAFMHGATYQQHTA